MCSLRYCVENILRQRSTKRIEVFQRDKQKKREKQYLKDFIQLFDEVENLKSLIEELIDWLNQQEIYVRRLRIEDGVIFYNGLLNSMRRNYCFLRNRGLNKEESFKTATQKLAELLELFEEKKHCLTGTLWFDY